MCIGHQKIFNIIFFDRLHSFDTFTAAILSLEIINSHPLDISQACHGNNSIFFRNKVFICKIRIIKSDFCSSLITVLIRNFKNFRFDNSEKKLFIGKNCFVLSYFLLKFRIFSFKLFTLQTCKSTKPHLNDSRRLCFGQSESFYQFLLSFRNVGASSYNSNYFINIIKGNKKSLQYMGTLFSLIKIIFCSSCNYVLLMLKIIGQHLKKVHNLGLIVNKRKIYYTESILKLCMFV